MKLITLTVASYNNAPVTTALSARLDELGGSIGRADSNQLVLPDPDRMISRVHAQVVFRREGHVLIDRGSNPVQLNGQTLGNGKEALLQDGDRIEIGGYLINVQLSVTASGGSAPASDPFADLLGPGAGLAPASNPSQRQPAAAFDPLHQPARPLPGTPPTPAGPAFAPAAPASNSTPQHAGGIPDDWNPFAPDPVAVPAAGAGSASRDFLGLDTGAGHAGPLVPGLGAQAPAESLDHLFGLSQPGGEDPFANHALGAAISGPNTASHADPLQAFSTLPSATAATLPDDFDALSLPFQAPAARPPAAVAPSSAAFTQSPEMPPVTQPAAGPKPAELPPVDEWLSALSAEISGYTRPGGVFNPGEDPFGPVPAAAAGDPAATGATRSTAPGADTTALLQAFLNGLNEPNVQVPALTPEFMHLLGTLVKAAAGGTVDLLVARAALKREVRAEATMIMARENNPLKFSPSAEAALQHLLGPSARGFMPPAQAMQDAYHDLRAHQFGMIAGMRAALEGVLERFNPTELESRIQQRTLLQNLLPGSRKAQLWALYTEHFAQIRADASDDFHNLFGKAFLAAYEADLDRNAEPRR